MCSAMKLKLIDKILRSELFDEGTYDDILFPKSSFVFGSRRLKM